MQISVAGFCFSGLFFSFPFSPNTLEWVMRLWSSPSLWKTNKSEHWSRGYSHSDGWKGGRNRQVWLWGGVAWIPSFAFPSLSCGSKSISWALWQSSYSVTFHQSWFRGSYLESRMPWKQILEDVRMSLADCQGSLTGFAHMLIHFFVPALCVKMEF